MVSENTTFDYKPKETHCFLDAEKYPSRISNSKIKSFFWVLPLLIILTASFVLSLYSVLKIQTMQDEVDYLRLEVDKLRHGLVDDDLFDDIKKFENDELYPDDGVEEHVVQPWLVNGGDDLEQDYDSNYEDEEDEMEEGLHTFINDQILENDENNDNPISLDHEDLTNLMTGGSMTKIGKETARTRRDVIASTYEGVPIISESYADMKQRNKTRLRTPQDNLRFYDHIKPVGGDGIHSAIPKLEGSYHSSAWINKHHSTQGLTHYEQLEAKNPTPPPPPVVSRRSRVMHAEDKSKAFRRVVKKPQLKSGSQMESVEQRHKESGGTYLPMPALRRYYLHQEQVGGPEFTVVRDDQVHHRRNRHRQRNNLETLDERPRTTGRIRPAIHFSGDTSKYVLGRHTNFNGDGHLRHPGQTFIDWAPSNWVKSLNMDEHFQLHEGYLNIKENGLYFVYAQIYYLDEHDTNGFRVHKNQETLLQCTTMTHSNDRVLKGNTCYTAGVEYLNEGDRISVRDLADGRYSLFEVGKSFFGAVKLGDIKIK